MSTVAVLAGAVIFGMPPPAGADFTLTLRQTGFTDVVITDNKTGDLDSDTGELLFTGTHGTFSTVIQIGTSNSSKGKEPATLTINNLTVASTGASTSTLEIILEDTGFTAPGIGPALMKTQLSTTSLTAGGSVSLQSFLNGKAGTKLTLGVAPDGVHVTDGVTIGTSPYTLSNVTTVTLPGDGTLQSTGTTTVITPGPAGAALALSALPLLGFGWLRGRRNARRAAP